MIKVLVLLRFKQLQVSNLKFYDRKSEGMNSFLQQTLVDGELVIDEHQGKRTPRFLIYDIIKFKVYSLNSNKHFSFNLKITKN